MEIPKGLTPEFLLSFLEGRQRQEIAASIRDGSPSAAGQIEGIVKRGIDCYFDRFDNGGGDAELSHLGWLCYMAGKYMERAREREAAIPFFRDAYRAFNHLTTKGRDVECRAILDEYPELSKLVEVTFP